MKLPPDAATTLLTEAEEIVGLIVEEAEIGNERALRLLEVLQRGKETKRDNAVVYGYARHSRWDHEDSVKIQDTEIAKAVSRRCPDLEYIGCYIDAGIGARACRRGRAYGSLRDMPWHQREGFLELLRVLRRGDHLFILRMDRLDGEPKRMFDCAERLAKRGIALHVVESMAGEPLDYDSAAGFAVLMSFMLSAKMYQQQHRLMGASLAAIRKKRGESYHAKPSYGKRRFLAETPDGRCTYVDRWDAGELQQIVELWFRRYILNEPYRTIVQDYYRRNELTANRELWTYKYLERGKRPDGQPYRYTRLLGTRVRRAVEWFHGALIEEFGTEVDLKTVASLLPARLIEAEQRSLPKPHPVPVERRKDLREIKRPAKPLVRSYFLPAKRATEDPSPS